MSKEIVKKNQKKMGLGRGLNSLLGNGSFVEEAVEKKDFAPSSSEDKKEMTAKDLLPPIARPQKVDSEAATVAAKPAADTRVVEKPSEAEAVEDQVKNVETKATSVDESKNPKVPDHMRVWQVRTDRIVANKEQPRKIFIDEELESLTASIKEKGILQPITVRKLAEDKFEIIAGERRWRAAQRAGLQEVPVLLKDVDDSTSLELALIENIQREDLNPVEEAEAYFHLIKKYKMTQQQLAEKIGKERATVANVLRLLNLSPEVRKMVASCEISLGQAKALMALSDPKKQKSLAIKARDNQLSVRAVEKLVAKYRDSKKEEPTEQDILKDKSVETLRVELQRMLGTKVSIDYNTGKGKISIAFYSDEELNGIIDKIRESWKK